MLDSIKDRTLLIVIFISYLIGRVLLCYDDGLIV